MTAPLVYGLTNRWLWLDDGKSAPEDSNMPRGSHMDLHNQLLTWGSAVAMQKRGRQVGIPARDAGMPGQMRIPGGMQRVTMKTDWY